MKYRVLFVNTRCVFRNDLPEVIVLTVSPPVPTSADDAHQRPREHRDHPSQNAPSPKFGEKFEGKGKQHDAAEYQQTEAEKALCHGFCVVPFLGHGSFLPVSGR